MSSYHADMLSNIWNFDRHYIIHTTSIYQPKCEQMACFCDLKVAPIPSTHSSNPRVLTKSVQQHFLTCVFDAGLINKAHSTDSVIHCGKARRLAQQLEASPVTTGHQRGKRHQPRVHSILFKASFGTAHPKRLHR